MKTMQQIALTVREARKYYRDLERCMNKYCKELDLPFTIDLSAYQNDHLLKSKPGLRSAITKDGCLHLDTTVPSALRCAKALLDHRIVGLWGLMQAGKTQAQIIAGILVAIYYHLSTGRDSWPVFFTLNGASYRGQFESKLTDLLRGFRLAQVVVAGKGYIDVESYFENITARLKERMEDELADLEQEEPVLAKKLRRQVEDELLKQYLVLPVSRKYLDFFRIITKVVRLSQGHIILMRDESHFAIADESVTDRMMEQDALDNETLYSIINEGGKDAWSAVLCSATNWPASELYPCRLSVNENYCGINIRYEFPPNSGNWNNPVVEDQESFRQIEIIGVSEFAKQVGNKTIPYINGGWYHWSDRFRQARDREEHPFRVYSRYRRAVEKSIGDAIVHLLVTGNSKKHRGVLVRFFNANDAVADLLESVEHRLAKYGIKTIRAYGSDTSYRTADELLRRNGCNKGGKYAVFVTARGRVSDSFPANCGYGLDFTWKSVHFATILQGVMGRLCGYFKDSFVVLSDKNNTRIQKSIDEGGVPIGSPAQSVSQSVPRSYFTFKKTMGDPIVAAITDKLTKVLQDRGTIIPRKRNGKRIWSVSLGKYFKTDLWTDCIEPHLGYLQKHLQNLQSGSHELDSLLIPGEDDREGRHYMMDEARVVCSWRQEGKDRHQHYGGRQGDTKNDLPMIIRGKIIRPGGKLKIIVTGFDLYNKKEAPRRHKLDENCVPSQIAKKKDDKKKDREK